MRPIAAGVEDALRIDAEQNSAGLDRLSDAEYEAFQRVNDAYRAKFGFPYIVCVRRHTRDSILADFERRLPNDIAAETAISIAEICRIAALRVDHLVASSDRLPVHGRLSTHVLDNHSGKPAAGIEVELVERSALGSSRVVTRTVTNSAKGGLRLVSNRSGRAKTNSRRTEAEKTRPEPRWSVRASAAGLAALTAIVYARTAWYPFVNFDDGEYVFENARVKAGLAPIISPLDTETVGASEVGPEVFLANASSVAVSVLALLLGVLLAIRAVSLDLLLLLRGGLLALLFGVAAIAVNLFIANAIL